jgi:CheY-like chemotaxis protein
MDVVREKCQNVVKIPDEKVPKSKAFTIGCPKCKHKNSVNSDTEAAPAPAKQNLILPKAETQAVAEGQEKKDDIGGVPGEGGFGFLEEGDKTALLCESNSDNHAKIRTALNLLGYKVMSPTEPREALKQLRFHDFDVVILNEMFGTRNPDVNHVHKHLSQLPMHSRRNIFVALISERFKTGDNMQTFNKSVNQMIHAGDIDRVEKILKRSIHDNDAFYRVMKESVKKLKC